MILIVSIIIITIIILVAIEGSPDHQQLLTDRDAIDVEVANTI